MNIPSVCSWELSSALGERAGLSGDAFLASRWSHWSGKDLESRISLTLNSYQYVMTSICHISSLNHIECLYHTSIYIYIHIYIYHILYQIYRFSCSLRWIRNEFGSGEFGPYAMSQQGRKCALWHTHILPLWGKKGHRNPWTSPLDKIRGEFLGYPTTSSFCHWKITFDSHLFWCHWTDLEMLSRLDSLIRLSGWQAKIRNEWLQYGFVWK